LINCAAHRTAIWFKFAGKVLSQARAQACFDLADWMISAQEIIRPAGFDLIRRDRIRRVRENHNSSKVQLAAQIMSQRGKNLLGLAGALNGLTEFEQLVDAARARQI